MKPPVTTTNTIPSPSKEDDDLKFIGQTLKIYEEEKKQKESVDRHKSSIQSDNTL